MMMRYRALDDLVSTLGPRRPVMAPADQTARPTAKESGIIDAYKRWRASNMEATRAAFDPRNLSTDAGRYNSLNLLLGLMTGSPGPKGGATKRLFRVEPASLDPAEIAKTAEWFKRVLPPKDYERFVSERGRLFGDNIDDLANYGHGAPDKITYAVDVPEDLAASFSRKHHADNFTEYLLPPEWVSKKRPYKP